MTGKFKEYDKKYSHLAGTALKIIENRTGYVSKRDIANYTSWNTEVWGKYETYSREKISWAVYDSVSAEEWQKWRVALKGLSTKEKLYCLSWILTYSEGSELKLMQIRVNNYLGALIRGGQLNLNLEVVR